MKTSIVFMVPLLLLFTIQVEAIHIRNLTFRRVWEWVQRLWASKPAESCPLLLKFTVVHGFAHPQGACTPHSQHILAFSGALSQLCSRYPLKSCLPPTCHPQKLIPVSAVLIPNQIGGLGS